MYRFLIHALLGASAIAAAEDPSTTPSTAAVPNSGHSALPPELTAADATVRLLALSTLVREGTPEALEWLTVVALFDPSWSVRQEAIYGLGEVGAVASVPTLEQSLQDANRRVREAAIEALTEIGGDQAATAMMFALLDEDADIREEAVYALEDIGGPVAIGVLRHALRDEDESVRESAAEVLEELKRNRARKESVPGRDPSETDAAD